MYSIQYLKLHPHAMEPTKAHWDDAGFDLYAVESFLLKTHTFARIPTGIAIQLPDRTEAQIRPRSGLAAKHGITILNGPGNVDAGYRGEVQVILTNQARKTFGSNLA